MALRMAQALGGGRQRRATVSRVQQKNLIGFNGCMLAGSVHVAVFSASAGSRGYFFKHFTWS